MKTLLPGTKRMRTISQSAKSKPWPTKLPDESWKEIPRFEGLYLVSSLGRIWSSRAQRILTGTKAKRSAQDGSSYLSIVLCREDERERKYVHVLVCETFIGPRPQGAEAAHDNGKRDDNRLDNLAWKTPALNASDKIRHGTILLGSRHQNSKLTEAQVLQIRRSNGTQRELAEHYGVSQSLISQLRQGVGWNHIKEKASAPEV